MCMCVCVCVCVDWSYASKALLTAFTADVEPVASTPTFRLLLLALLLLFDGDMDDRMLDTTASVPLRCCCCCCKGVVAETAADAAFSELSDCWATAAAAASANG